MNKIRISNLIYLAGLIDGDGSLIAQLVARKDYVNRFQIRFTIQITQLTKRRCHLDKIRENIGAGSVRVRGELSDYVLTSTKDVDELLRKLYPFLRIKKKQAELIIQIIEQLPSSKNSPTLFLELCRKADQVARLNDSKNRTITAESVENKLKKIGRLKQGEKKD